MNKQNDYLWDAGGEPDCDVANLERALAGAKWAGDLPSLAGLAVGQADPAKRRPWRLTLLAVAALALAVLRINSHFAGPSYRVEWVSGGVAVDGAPRDSDGGLSVGERLTTGQNGSAILHIDGLGSVHLSHESSLALLDPKAGSASSDWGTSAKSFLSLDQGSFEAFIYAKPGAFQVQTPAGLSVDLGCIYTATVRDDGSTLLRVTTGRVAFEGAGRKVIVPSGASIFAAPGEAPSTPIFADADREFVSLIGHLDSDGKLGADEASRLLATARPRDAVSLVHLLNTSDLGPKILDHLLRTRALPKGITRKASLTGDKRALQAWLDSL